MEKIPINETYDYVLDDDDAKLLEKRFKTLQSFWAVDNVSLRKKMSRFYHFVDLSFNLFKLKERSVCKTGCSHCCHVDVEIIYAEAAYIQEMTGIKHNEIYKKQKNDFHKTKTPCPFLKDNNCSIYEFRPIACRAFFTIDSVEFCKRDDSPKHEIFTIESWPTLMKFYSKIFFSGNRRYGDIREWFSGENVNQKKWDSFSEKCIHEPFL
jgi:Fe-S-cluster containining protein